jgi:hypothetical protein
MEKSWLEPRYREIYTKLCKALVNEPKLIVTDPETNRKRYIFKDAILNIVQHAFQNEDYIKKHNNFASLDDDAL